MPPRLVSLHLHRVATRRVPAALGRMGVDRVLLRGTPGLRFAKLLGTGDGRTFDLRDADLRLWGLLAVWSSPGALAAYERSSPVAAGWRRLASETWRADLRLLSSRGRWSGIEPFGATTTDDRSGPVAALTRARLRWRTMPRFWQAVPAVVADLHRQEGLLMSVGVGEAPIGLQGTFSVWRSAEDLRAFAYRRPAHLEAIRGTETLGWYTEELFARFALVQTTGRLSGSIHSPACGTSSSWGPGTTP